MNSIVLAVALALLEAPVGEPPAQGEPSTQEWRTATSG